ncbi:ATP-binding protein [Oryzobacter telluris]|uniref:ATP-binding protein n=1 Tax=Oryzobacter telluris TaxID=3149179 RepID=UPI00370D5774
MRRASLAGRLSAALVVATLLVAGVGGVLSYQRSLGEARDLQDDVLMQVATLAASTSTSVPTTDRDPLSDTTSDIDITTLSTSGLAADPGPGPHTVVVDGSELRVVVASRQGAEPLVISQALQVREEIARGAALSATLPLALLIPVLLAAIVLGVRRVLAPVDRLAAELDGRSADDLSPLHAGDTPSELSDFIGALNGQLDRVRAAQDHERLFIAQAAHELRTPLTALSLQLERASAAKDPDAIKARLTDARAGVDRSRRLVDQLLELARAQSSPESATRVDRFDSVLRSAVGDVLDSADRRQVRLEVTAGGEDATPVPATETASVLRNLLDNAIRHGPAGGLVTVAARTSATDLTVVIEDQGPGIRDTDHVLRPFEREAGQSVEGSGLGLAIVVEQLRRVGGTLTLSDRPDATPGLRAVVSLPTTPHPSGQRRGAPR